jgi:hypothetical protein
VDCENIISIMMSWWTSDLLEENEDMIDDNARWLTSNNNEHIQRDTEKKEIEGHYVYSSKQYLYKNIYY